MPEGESKVCKDHDYGPPEPLQLKNTRLSIGPVTRFRMFPIPAKRAYSNLAKSNAAILAILGMAALRTSFTLGI